jgi:hypothetical protein
VTCNSIEPVAGQTINHALSKNVDMAYH